ncbi:hypothetical protein SSTU70S_05206 [Stutzerimonas stutzeri]
MALKKQFDAIKYDLYPWIKDMHRDSHAPARSPILGKGFWHAPFFADLKAGKQAHEPRFKKKGRCRDSFYVANDKFALDGNSIRLPKIGAVAMTEALRFEGKILGATVSRAADRWFVAVQVDVPEAQALRRRTGHGTVGVDLGLKAAATLSSGESIPARTAEGRAAPAEDSQSPSQPQAGGGQARSRLRPRCPAAERRPAPGVEQPPQVRCEIGKAARPYCQSQSGFHP